MNEYFWQLAEKAAQCAADIGLVNIDPKWIYSQWAHETADFTSELCVNSHNLGGLTQSEPNGMPQPDGSYYYMQFSSYEEYADYFGHYLYYFKDGGIDQAGCLQEYISALKNSPSGAYFGDSLEIYLSGCEEIYAECFGEEP
jgi:hypothetical protein